MFRVIYFHLVDADSITKNHLFIEDFRLQKIIHQ